MSSSPGFTSNRTAYIAAIDDGTTYADYIASLAPLLWLKHTETSGTTVENYGSLGDAADGTWTPGAGALGQTGLGNGGANEAYDYDGANSKTTVPAQTGINNLTALTYGILLKADSPGETNVGQFFGDQFNNRIWGINSASYPLSMTVQATGAAVSTTNNGFIAVSTPTYLFATYDDAGDRKIRMYKVVGGALTEATYATQTAATGTLGNGSGTQIIGNTANQAASFDGLIDEAFMKGSVLSSAEMLQIGLLRGL
jgi:hypothetical protein